MDSVDFNPPGTSGTQLKAAVSAKAYIYGTGPTADGGLPSAGLATPATPATPAPTTPGATTPPASAAPSTAAAPAAGSSS